MGGGSGGFLRGVSNKEAIKGEASNKLQYYLGGMNKKLAIFQKVFLLIQIFK